MYKHHVGYLMLNSITLYMIISSVIKSEVSVIGIFFYMSATEESIEDEMRR